MNPKKFGMIMTTALASLSLVSCTGLKQSFDVVGNQSIDSFDAVLQAIPDSIEGDATNRGWSLTAPDGAARFVWTKDSSQSPTHDVMVEFDAQPFVDAGLDLGQLPETIYADDGRLMVGTTLGGVRTATDQTPLAAYRAIVKAYPDAIGYHPALDHYGVNLGDGNLFEWAKDLTTNDKDIVFVLNPEPFIAAGVDPNAIEGWVFGKVTVDVDGKPTEVDKLLKPFNLN